MKQNIQLSQQCASNKYVYIKCSLQLPSSWFCLHNLYYSDGEWLHFQVSFEADLGRYPGFVGVRGLQVQPGYCHPVPLRATQGTCSHDAVLFFFFC